MSLERLMQQSLAGDKNAYNTVLTETATLLRPYLCKRLGDPSAADDVLQEILISIHKARHTYDGTRPFKPWLFAIARFRLQDYLRKYYGDTLRFAGDLDEIDEMSVSHVTESPLSYESIRGEIDQLQGKQPQILGLLHNEGYTAKEVALQLGMQESAVKVAAHRAYKILRKRLGG